MHQNHTQPLVATHQGVEADTRELHALLAEAREVGPQSASAIRKCRMARDLL